MSALIDWLIYSNLWISMGAVAFMHTSALILKFSYSWQLYLLAFLGTLCTYNLSVFYISKPTSPKFIFMGKYRQILQFLAIFSGLLSFLVAVLLGVEAVLFLIHLGFISIFYTIPVTFKNSFVSKKMQWKTLREIPYLKIILVGYVWASVAVILPLVALQKPVFEVHSVALFFIQFLFVSGITLPFDIRDFRTDKKTGLKTLAQKGSKRTKFLGLSCLGISWIILAFYFTDFELIIAFFMTYFVAGILIFYASPKRPELYYTGWIDGTIILQLILIAIMTNL